MLDKRLNDWTEQRVDLLKALWADGLSCSRIAMEIGGITRNAVIGKVSRLGLPGRTILTRKARYRSGPISFTEKMRRETERAEMRAAAQRERHEARREKRERQQNGSLAPLIIIEPPQPAEFLALTFAELQRSSCRYPRGEGDDIRFCGQPRMKGRSYCSHCYRICHNNPTRPDTEARPKTGRLNWLIQTKAA